MIPTHLIRKVSFSHTHQLFLLTRLDPEASEKVFTMFLNLASLFILKE